MGIDIWYFLSVLPGIGPVKTQQLLSQFPEPGDILTAKKHDLLQCPSITEQDADRILLYSRKTDTIEKQYEALAQKGIAFIGRTDPGFPKGLLHCQEPPVGLYVKGQLQAETENTVAIVGARMCSAYGKLITRQIAGALADCGVAVVSGMARGIDGIAHEEAMAHGGITYAVLAGGVDMIYPPEHRQLYENIIAHGAVISEYPPGTRPAKGMFPRRNRLISGLARTVILTEAREKSGSLITADQALEQGKDIFVVPGRIGDPLSAGCNNYIRQGAQIITSVPELLYDLKVSPKKDAFVEPGRKIVLEKEESLVYSCLRLTPKGLDEITLESGLGLLEVLEIVSRLRDMGLIEESYRNQYSRSR